MALLRKLALYNLWSLIGLKYLAIAYNPIKSVKWQSISEKLKTSPLHNLQKFLPYVLPVVQ